MSEQNKHYLRPDRREYELSPKQRTVARGLAAVAATGAFLAVHDKLNDTAEQRQPEATTTTTVEVTEVPDPGQQIEVERGGQDLLHNPGE